MATITNAGVTALLAELENWFGPHGTIAGVVDDTTEDTVDFTFVTNGGTTVSITYLELADEVTAKQEIIAAEADVLAAAVASDDYGPLVRTTAVGDMPWDIVDSPRIGFTTKNGNAVSLRFSELETAAVRNRLVYQVEGIGHRFSQLKADLNTLNTTVQALTAGSYSDWETAINGIRDLKREYLGE